MSQEIQENLENINRDIIKHMKQIPPLLIGPARFIMIINYLIHQDQYALCIELE